MASAGKSQLLTFMDELIPTIRTALCDRFFSKSYLVILVHKMTLRKVTSDHIFCFSLLTAYLRFVSLQAWHSVLFTRYIRGTCLWFYGSSSLL